MQKLKTIKENVTIEIEEKRSKFIANIFYIESVEEAEKRITILIQEDGEIKEENFVPTED